MVEEQIAHNRPIVGNDALKYLLIFGGCCIFGYNCGVEQWLACLLDLQKAAGSNPAPATFFINLGC